MTDWSTLNSDVALFCERDVSTDDEFVQALPRFIANAEKRIYDECPLTLFNQEESGTMSAGDPFIPRPEGMTRSGTLTVKSTSNEFVPVFARLRTNIAEFWPSRERVSDYKPPRYWAPYDASTIIVAPTPSLPFVYRFLFQGSLPPLSAASPTNALTREHYDMLLAATIVEACRYSQEDQSTQLMERYEAQYQGLKAAAIVNDLGISISDAVPAEPRATGA